MAQFKQCGLCKHLLKYEKIGVPRCKAYPDEIPVEILLNEVWHTKSYKQDNDIVFELGDRKFQKSIFYSTGFDEFLPAPKKDEE